MLACARAHLQLHQRITFGEAVPPRPGLRTVVFGSAPLHACRAIASTPCSAIEPSLACSRCRWSTATASRRFASSTTRC